MSICERIDAGGIEAHDRGGIHPVVEFFAVASRHVDLVTDDDVLQEGEMRIAMRRIDGDATFAGVGRPFDVTRAEGERLAAAACQHDGAGMEPLHLDAGDRPSVCP
jgi:hypothetical protein